MKTDRKVIVYIAASLDGYIAGPNDDLGFLSVVEQEGEDYGYADFIKTVDTYIITRTPRPAAGKTSFYTGNLPELVSMLKSREGKTIFIDGGAEVVNELLKAGLIDELIISVIPVLVGNGVRLFNDNRPLQQVKLQSAKQFDSGLVQLHYVCMVG